MEKEARKPHHLPKSGVKAKKKQQQNLKRKGKTEVKQTNVKGNLPGKNAVKAQRRNLDIEAKKLHTTIQERALNPSSISDDVPPVIVAVVGPPNVGKSTIIKSLVKHYTKQNIGEVKGPITLVSGKKRRLTFIECQNDLNSMLDCAKIADLALLLIDAHFGFEMETFEYLNMLQTHGFPNVMGVLTHLDQFKSRKSLNRTKKVLKHRFWTEIYQGAKLFYLSGLINGKYPNNEIHNLARFISVMKFRPLTWRNSHPYFLCDRVEDMTHPQKKIDDPTCDRTVAFYGYLRGTHLKPDMKIHIPGCGDFFMDSITELADPCPLPDKKKRQVISAKEKLIYCPMGDVGNITFDKDATYINIPDHKVSFTKLEDENGEEGEDEEEDLGQGEKMVRTLQDTSVGIDERLKSSKISLFAGSTPIESSSVQSSRRPVSFSSDLPDFGDDDDEEDDDDDGDDDDGFDFEKRIGGRKSLDNQNEDEQYAFEDDDEDVADFYRSNNNFDDDDDNDEDDQAEDSPKSAKKGRGEKLAEQMKVTAEKFFKNRAPSLMEMVYNTKSFNSDSEEEEDDDGELLKLVKQKSQSVTNYNLIDSSKSLSSSAQPWKDDDEIIEKLRSKFATANWFEGVDEEILKDDEEVYGDFEDLETGEVHGSKNDDDSDNDDDDGMDEDVKKALEQERWDKVHKKEKLKAQFGEEYNQSDDDDDTFHEDEKKKVANQHLLNLKEFENEDPQLRAQLIGYSNSYVRVIISSIPCEFIDHFNPQFPVIIGGLLQNEQNLGFVQTRVKKHRWHRKILKNNDPIIISMGWRRFQTLPIYSIADHNLRHRMLKYTPEHMHCFATFYGPITPPNTGFIALQQLSNSVSNFRIAASGVVVELNQSFKIVKKLKLTGVPYKIYKNTAFIKDMFNSSLEVAKFEGASIRTVSGIRGQIKKAERSPEGAFRASFEDKILLRDIVFMRTWYPITPHKYYNPVSSLLSSDKATGWTRMRTTFEVRRDKKLPIPVVQDSIYKEIVRKERKFNPLRIPTQLEKGLPFASKPKVEKLIKNNVVPKRAVIVTPEERNARALIAQLGALKNEKIKKKKLKREEKLKEKAKKESKQKEVWDKKAKESRKRVFRLQGQEEKKKNTKRQKIHDD